MDLRNVQCVILSGLIALILCACSAGRESVQKPESDSLYAETHRPLFHFSPKEKWMNDPNGMVYHKGNYHLFYQHYPDSTVWGPMHWGHAVSKDLVHWQHLPIALYPDSLGMIFSGSAVVDHENTSGLGSSDNPPLVAIFTYHAADKEKDRREDYQSQGLAYSTDDGATWKKYAKNPVLQNPGIKDFRDPKVFWYAPDKKWVMTLAVQDHIEFYSSSDLLKWTKLSEFGKNEGAHGGVWECPDLFELPVEDSDEIHWILLVSINPGGPNGGSATQYFVGSFDGKTFQKTRNLNDTTLWLDHGPDNYAGVTWSNAPDNRKIFLGWMSNWAYADVVPTVRWRGATTVPRELTLRKSGFRRLVASRPVPELKRFGSIDDTEAADKSAVKNPGLMIIEGEITTETFDYFEFSNDNGESLRIGWDEDENRFYIDRSDAGNVSFSNGFITLATCPRIAKGEKIPYTIVMDVSSAEVFFDDGLSVMTATFFAEEPLTKVLIMGTGDIHQPSTSHTTYLKKIW